ncbi:alpha/beta hydrolase domain-containing protein [Mycobacterium vicinigordonae]|uniref:Alpha/beta hydrolase domain-containing protein n=1 Tax=Mycobacterium vicinigordonae TaxID=1719132 RepID=A0A7D6HUN9_9MYCO|nr:alpha/beta hydrolase domain-containing protein [Mycobacterium vicinigordonae]QLL07852.1 hypothetical protein H0P51_02300 [Mycobacterium vicinigordonae]
MIPTATAVPGQPALLLGAFDIGSVGYTVQEFFVSGTARSYVPESDLRADGCWTVTPSATANYTTRIVVLTPTDPARFNGTALVEWLNVSGGIDAPAVWMMAHREVIRAGYSYIMVSALKVGVDGGTSLLGIDMSLKSQNAERYAALSHPGDVFAYDIFSQAGELVRDGRVLGGLAAEHVVALGESQSAMFLTSYVNAVDPLARVYDGFLVHSRFGPAAPLGDGSIFDQLQPDAPDQAVKFRPDLRVPVMTIITETDLYGAGRQGYYAARRPDDDLLRVWEIAGSAHADNYTIQVAFIDSGSAPLDAIVGAYQPTNILMGQQLDHFINFGPQHHYVAQAALAALNDWVATGAIPPAGPALEVREAEQPQPVLDVNGIAVGGVRTPWVDVPIARTSGAGEMREDNIMGAIFGFGEPFDEATLGQLYPGGFDEYIGRFTAALDSAIGAGFILAADRDEILQLTAATYPRG